MLQKLMYLKSLIAVRAEFVAELIQIAFAVGVSGGVRKLHRTAVERTNHLIGEPTSENARKNTSRSLARVPT